MIVIYVFKVVPIKLYQRKVRGDKKWCPWKEKENKNVHSVIEKINALVAAYAQTYAQPKL